MQAELSQSEAALDAEYYCLHHPEALLEKYKALCDCRKPRPGLILKAALELNIDLGLSWLIGDNLSDIMAGKSAGCRTILLGKMKCELCRLMDQRNVKPDKICENLLEASGVVLLDKKNYLREGKRHTSNVKRLKENYD
jgi:histidinol phosphatase-like enzyme